MSPEYMRARFRREGEEWVRKRVEGRMWDPVTRQFASDWLKQQAALNAASTAEHEKRHEEREQAAVDAAWAGAFAARRANWIALGAVVISIFAVFVAVIAIYAQLAE
ncbi:hypothetical protein [Sphingobium yanoikuyae]|uniref:hypothetical protein n=1 Tax=Sphingobium yanoikuyae TaxID=13690 RepID=UPI00241C5830|nr:hypothetical protein [Sphingobium yanoikuyae]